MILPLPGRSIALPKCLQQRKTDRRFTLMTWSHFSVSNSSVGARCTGFKVLKDLSGGPERWTFGPAETALATGDHHIGGLRMSKSPDDGIVNPDCRFHGIDNLYAASSAVFPTSGYANPPLTIVALAPERKEWESNSLNFVSGSLL